jgi:uncharacterized membrane protein
MRPKARTLANSLIAFPLGLLVVSPIFDIILLATKNAFWGHLGFWTLTVGLLGGLVSVGAEVWKFRHTHPATRPYRISLFEIGVFLTALLFYVTSWVIQVAVGLEAGLGAVGGGELACSLLGSVILLMACVSGPMVDRFRIGLSEDPTADAAAHHAQREQGLPENR